MTYDYSKDTLNVKYFTLNNRITQEKYLLNKKIILLINYNYANDGTWEAIRSDGIVNKYFANGQLRIATKFVKGKLDGVYLTYHENGNRHCVCQYLEDKREGFQAIYWENGQLNRQEEYRNGLLWNILSRFDSNGKPIDIGTFKDGNGFINSYDKDWSVYEILYYEKGIMLKKELQKK